MNKKKFNLVMIVGLLFVITLYSSCSTEDATPTTTGSPIGKVPTKFTQKVMIEENTGNWCGWCVLGADGIKTAEEMYPGKINAVALHGGTTEPMYVPEYTAMLAFCGATGVPHYQLQRVSGGGFPGTFISSITAALAMVPECGLAIDARKSSGDNISFIVHAGFLSDLTGDYRLIVYLVEDSVKIDTATYNQQNYVSGNSKYPTNYYFSQPPVITNFPHKHVARKLLSASLSEGDQIPPEYVKTGKEYVKTYTYTIPAGSIWNSAKLRVVAGILKYDAKCANQFMMNSQSVKLGAAKNWD
jgi:hypothetical protein